MGENRVQTNKTLRSVGVGIPTTNRPLYFPKEQNIQGDAVPTAQIAVSAKDQSNNGTHIIQVQPNDPSVISQPRQQLDPRLLQRIADLKASAAFQHIAFQQRYRVTTNRPTGSTVHTSLQSAATPSPGVNTIHDSFHSRNLRSNGRVQGYPSADQANDNNNVVTRRPESQGDLGSQEDVGSEEEVTEEPRKKFSVSFISAFFLFEIFPLILLVLGAIHMYDCETIVIVVFLVVGIVFPISFLPWCLAHCCGKDIAPYKGLFIMVAILLKLLSIRALIELLWVLDDHYCADFPYYLAFIVTLLMLSFPYVIIIFFQYWTMEHQCEDTVKRYVISWVSIVFATILWLYGEWLPYVFVQEMELFN